MLGYLEPGTTSVLVTGIAAMAGTIVMFARSGWRSTLGRFSPKRRREAKEQAEAAAQAEQSLETVPPDID